MSRPLVSSDYLADRPTAAGLDDRTSGGGSRGLLSDISAVRIIGDRRLFLEAPRVECPLNVDNELNGVNFERCRQFF
jgi:hypothetical protein